MIVLLLIEVNAALKIQDYSVSILVTYREEASSDATAGIGRSEVALSRHKKVQRCSGRYFVSPVYISD